MLELSSTHVGGPLVLVGVELTTINIELPVQLDWIIKGEVV